MQHLFKISFILFIALAFFASGFWVCGKIHKPKPKVTDTVTIYQEVPVYHERYTPVVKTKLIPRIDTIIIRDTVQILTNYYTANVYADTLTDSLFTILLIDTIRENQIISRHYSGAVRQKETIINNTITPKASQFSAGIGATLVDASIAPCLYAAYSYKRAGVFCTLSSPSATVGAMIHFFSKSLDFGTANSICIPVTFRCIFAYM